jgi:maltose-binding protein MalE
MMIKKIGLVLLSCVFLSFCACVSISETDTGSNAVCIEFWEQGGFYQQELFDQLIAEFQQKNSGITVRHIRYEADDLRNNFTSPALGGIGPDVVLGPNDNLSVFVPGNLIIPVNDVMGDAFLEEFDASALGASRYDGRTYMIPDRNGNELCLIYNKKMIPTPPETWDELVAMGNALREKKQARFAVAVNMVEPFFTIPFLKSFGGEVFDNPSSRNAQPTFDTQAVRDWCSFIKTMQTNGVFPNEADYDAASNLFKEGKTPFMINGPWSFPDYSENAQMDIGIAAIPKVNGIRPAPYSAVKGYSISKVVMSDRIKKAAVKKFLVFITGHDAQVRMSASHGQLPALLAAMNDMRIKNNVMLSMQRAQLEHCIPMPLLPQMRAVWAGVKPVQARLFAGKINPEEAAVRMQSYTLDGIKALGLPVLVPYPVIIKKPDEIETDESSSGKAAPGVMTDYLYGYSELVPLAQNIDSLGGNVPDDVTPLYSGDNLVTVFVETFFNSAANPEISNGCVPVSTENEAAKQLRLDFYRYLQEDRKESLFYLSHSFSSGNRYDSAKAGFDIRYINVAYTQGVVSDIMFSKEPGDGPVLEIDPAVFIGMNRTDAEQTCSDSTASMALVFSVKGTRMEGKKKILQITPHYMAVASGAAGYYEKRFIAPQE